jgi:hypothetical protein
MKKNLLLSASLFFCYLLSAGIPNGPKGQDPQQIVFTQNKGQVSDQNHQPRPDVLFSGSDGKMVYHIKNNGISYQLNRVDSEKREKHSKGGEELALPEKVTVYRLDLRWKNCNTHILSEMDEVLEGSGNYYLAVCPEGVTDVKSFKGITLKNIYNNIDVHYYGKNGSLKHDYIVAPGADYRQIQVEIKGAEIQLLEDGSVLLKSPLGDVQEGAPLVFQNGKQLKASWQLRGQVLSFEIPDYNPNESLLIDPLARVWGTYYGGTGTDYAMDCTTDPSGNVYLAGYSSSSTGTNIATTGSHQQTFGGSSYDAYLAKFNTNGIRLWATYYGGTSLDYGQGCATDLSGNVYLTGYSNSASAISTAGSHQPTVAGGYDAFLVKFNASGIRQWGTYYGNSTTNYGYACCTDNSGNVYMVGISGNAAGTAIATAGAHQTTYGGSTYDAFLVKFNTSGVRQWGTYYGGTALDYGQSCCTDPGGNVYLAGYSGSSAGIATAGGHQNSFGGSSYDAFLVKFNTSGVQQWGTYYGGTALDYGYGCATDASSNVYLAGYSGSNAGIATPLAHQLTYGGSSYDAFIVQFNASGVRNWGTYYGGTGLDYGRACRVSTTGNVLLAGYTNSGGGGTVIAVPNADQPGLTSGYDAFLAEFNSSGVRQYGTYYGGSGTDYGYGVAKGPSGVVYLCGYSTSNGGTWIATPGSHQPNVGGGADGFLAKFAPCTYPNSPNNTTPAANTTICAGYSATLTATGSGTLSWYASPTSTVVLGTGTSFVTPTLAAGNYTYYVGAFTCGPSATRTAISLLVNPSPVVTVSNATICVGSSTVVTASGANTYTWNPGAMVGASQNLSPIVTTVYTVSGTSGGCTAPTTMTVFVDNMPTTAVTSATLCSGFTTTLVASGATTYSWEPGSLTGSSQALNPMSTTVYTVVGANGSCSNSATGTITVYTSPVITVSDATICSGTSTVMTAGGASTYTWIPGNFVGATQTLSPAGSTNYTITGSDGTCASSNTMNITVHITPTVTVNSGTICAGESFTMVPANAVSYTFSSGSAVVSPTTHSSYTVTGTSAEGCVSSPGAVSTVSVNNVPNITISGPGALCQGQTINLTANGASSYTWSTGANSPGIVLTPTANGSYSVTGSFASGCTGNTAVKNVVVNPKPDLIVESTSTLICKGEAKTMTVTGADTYSWSTGSLNNTVVVSPPVTTQYNVVGTYTATGCQTTQYYTLTVSACTGLETLANSETESRVYPNPSTGNFVVELPMSADMLIFNALGDVILRDHVEAGKNYINIEGFAQGMYFLQIFSADYSKTFKIMKE